MVAIHSGKSSEGTSWVEVGSDDLDLETIWIRWLLGFSDRKGDVEVFSVWNRSFSCSTNCSDLSALIAIEANVSMLGVGFPTKF